MNFANEFVMFLKNLHKEHGEKTKPCKKNGLCGIVQSSRKPPPDRIVNIDQLYYEKKCIS